MRVKRNFIKGGYFSYCQWCRWDGHCNLRHYQLMGAKPGDKVDSTPYPGHEDLKWHLSAFQNNNSRAACRGRVYVTEDPFYFPLACECGTIIDSFCQKFRPNEKGRERMKAAMKIAKERNIELGDVDQKDLSRPDPDYASVM